MLLQIEIPLSSNQSREAPASASGSPAKSSAPGDVDVLPDYLPEDEDDGECTPEDDPRSAVATTGVALKEAATSLFSAAASLLQQSFYW